MHSEIYYLFSIEGTGDEKIELDIQSDTFCGAFDSLNYCKKKLMNQRNHRVPSS